MDESDSAVFEWSATSPETAGTPSLDGMAAIERQLQERLARLNAGTQEFQAAPGRLHFWVDDQQYSTALSDLRQALTSLPPVSPLPYSPPWLVGLFPLRADFVALIDLRAFLRADGEQLDAADIETKFIEQALLVGEDGRLLAFGVDRIGNITSHREPRAGTSGVGDPAELVTRSKVGDLPLGAPVANEIIALSLSQLHEEVIARLEEWAHHV